MVIHFVVEKQRLLPGEDLTRKFHRAGQNQVGRRQGLGSPSCEVRKVLTPVTGADRGRALCDGFSGERPLETPGSHHQPPDRSEVP